MAGWTAWEGWAMFGGTLAAKGGIRPGKVFRMELEDPVRKRTLAHEVPRQRPAGRRLNL